MAESDLQFTMPGQMALVTGALPALEQQSGGCWLPVARQSWLSTEMKTERKNYSEAWESARHRCRRNVSNREAVGRVVEEVVRIYGKLDIPVNWAGVVSAERAESLAVEQWDDVLAANLRGKFLMSQAVGWQMLVAQRGRIVNIASQAASVGREGLAAYCASKAGVVALVQVMALEWGHRGVTVNAVSPTVVMTELGRRAWSGERGEQMRSLIPTRRFAEPDEVAAAVLFLCTGAAAMINGVDLLLTAATLRNGSRESRVLPRSHERDLSISVGKLGNGFWLRAG